MGQNLRQDAVLGWAKQRAVDAHAPQDDQREEAAGWIDE